MPLQSSTSAAAVSLIAASSPRFRSCSSPLALVAPSALAAQGVTTSAINGFVTGDDGKPLADAVIVAVHVPSGTDVSRTSRGPAAPTACSTCGSAAPTG